MSSSRLLATRLSHQQESSRLMQFPQDLGDQIYSDVFSDTYLTFGKDFPGRLGRRNRSSLAALSLLLSCRRAHHELGNAWLHLVTFQFGDPTDMLDKLTNLPPDILSQIRQLRIYGTSLKLPIEDDESFFRTAQALKLLPRLQLDVLTVIGDDLANVSYDTLNMLIRYGGGWRELHYIGLDSTFLGYEDTMIYFGPRDSMYNRYMRRPQPADWQQAMEQRDGEASKPSVTIYCSNDQLAPSAVFPLDRCEMLVQTLAPGQNAQSYGRCEDQNLMRTGEVEKAILVVVKRGEGVDYAELEEPTHLPVDDIRWAFDMSTWQEIKDYQKELFDELELDDD